MPRLNHMQPSSPLTYARAKHMRRQPTEAERRLWGALRNRTLGGLKFYRQVPIGPYIVDFINHELGVVIEVDGPSHADDVAHDERRTAYLCLLGLLVHRVENGELFRDLDAALGGIFAVVTERAAKGPHPLRAKWRSAPSPEVKGQA
jgi:very-short-patch-repair endonuclease